jgi:hypothetical protein
VTQQRRNDIIAIVGLSLGATLGVGGTLWSAGLLMISSSTSLATWVRRSA